VDKVLEGLRTAHPIIPLILEYRGLLKAKTSFVDVAIRRARWEDGQWVIHCNFRITRVSSGRLSATGPNLMAVMGGALGEEIRAGYLAGGDYEFAEWDLNQIEMRVMASEANDEFLISMMMNDEDIHAGTTDRMFNLNLPRPYNKKQVPKDKRDAAKRTGFGVITGIQAPGLVDQMRLQGVIVSEEEAAKWIIDWLASCPSVPIYMDRCHREARQFGYVRDWTGRIRFLPGIHSPFRHIRAEAGRQSHSHKIQAGAQGIMKVAMASIWTDVLPYWRAQGKYVEPILQVHDSLMLRRRGFNRLESEEMDAQVRAAMFAAAPPGFRVPLDAGSGTATTWGLLEH
jgi:DNA polymerase-1